jgi:hypothetical protein
MVPSAYVPYLTASATASAALIGLLFVAVSVRDATIFGPNAVPGGAALAITAFSGLVNAFVVSLLGLLPDSNIGWVATTMGVLDVVAVVRLHNRLHWARSTTVLAIAIVAYLAQLGLGLGLLASPHDSSLVGDLAFVVFIAMIGSLQRAWSLMTGEHLARAAAAESGGGSSQ